MHIHTHILRFGFWWRDCGQSSCGHVGGFAHPAHRHGGMTPFAHSCTNDRIILLVDACKNARVIFLVNVGVNAYVIWQTYTGKHGEMVLMCVYELAMRAYNGASTCVCLFCANHTCIATYVY
jgi:hypothetical protein